MDETSTTDARQAMGETHDAPPLPITDWTVLSYDRWRMLSGLVAGCHLSGSQSPRRIETMVTAMMEGVTVTDDGRYRLTGPGGTASPEIVRSFILKVAREIPPSFSDLNDTVGEA